MNVRDIYEHCVLLKSSLFFIKSLFQLGTKRMCPCSYIQVSFQQAIHCGNNINDCPHN